MSFRSKLMKELKAVALTTSFFAAWFGLLVLLKSLILAEYAVRFGGLSVALIGALIVAKVVLVLEHVPLGGWVRRQAAVVDPLLRTALYSLGVVLVLMAEKAFEGRHEHGGFVPALVQGLGQQDIHHVLATTIGVSGALLIFNLLALLREQVGAQSLRRAFLAPRAEPSVHEPPAG